MGHKKDKLKDGDKVKDKKSKPDEVVGISDASSHFNSEDEGHEKLPGNIYEEELAKLQVELVRLQEWIKYKGLRVVVLFEGRDAAG